VTCMCLHRGELHRATSVGWPLTPHMASTGWCGVPHATSNEPPRGLLSESLTNVQHELRRVISAGQPRAPTSELHWVSGECWVDAQHLVYGGGNRSFSPKAVTIDFYDLDQHVETSLWERTKHTCSTVHGI